MLEGFQFVGLLAALLFTGAALYVNLAEHPARMECGTLLAATVFGPSYRRAAGMQVILALAATVGSVGAWFMGAPRAWLVGAVVVFAVVPFTLMAILPTNKKLLDPALDRSSLAAHLLLVQWGRLHAVRSILSLLASVIFLWSLIWLWFAKNTSSSKGLTCMKIAANNRETCQLSFWVYIGWFVSWEAAMKP